jgi:K+-transporting ATPase ATPase C chain
MNAHLRANLWLLGLTVLLCCVLYPLALWAIGQGVFADKAAGSLLDKDGKPTRDEKQAVGSRLIAQPFKAPEYFWPRPSAVSFDASASGGSNLGANNPKLRARVIEDLSRIKYRDGPKKDLDVPSDMVMTSGSGLDPHITLNNARYQLDRVVDAWAKKTGADSEEVRKAIENLLKQKAAAPFGGLAGEELINVLEVNLALPGALKGISKRTGGAGGPA